MIVMTERDSAVEIRTRAVVGPAVVVADFTEIEEALFVAEVLGRQLPL